MLRINVAGKTFLIGGTIYRMYTSYIYEVGKIKLFI